MSKDHWDAILASAPLNATAATVTGKGVGFAPELQPEPTWEGPPPLKDVRRYAVDPGFADLTGKRVGRFHVLGMAEDSQDPKGKKGALWVCRCACGRYVGRRSKSLKSGATQMCNWCGYTEHLRWASSGSEPRKRAESDKARKWRTPEEDAA